MRAFTVAALLFLAGAPSQELDLAVAAPQLTLARSQGRVWKNSSGYLARVVGSAPVVAEFVLPEPLPPGRYLAFVRGQNGGGGVRLQLSCGKTSSPEICPQDWSEPIPIDVDASTTALTLTFKPSASAVEPRQFVLSGLFFTTRQDVVLDRNDHLLPRSLRPLRVEPPDPSRGNLIPNGSFEVGLGQGWELSVPGEKRDYSIAALWDETQGSDGSACVRLPAHATLSSRVLRLRPDRRHTLSVRARSQAAGATLTLTLDAAEARIASTKGYGPWTKVFPVSSEWTRLDLTGDPSVDLSEEVQVHLNAHDQPVWVDELQLVEGEPSDFRPRRPLEVGLRCLAPANLFFDDERATMRLLTRNSSGQPYSGKVRLEIRDYLDRRVKTGAVDVAVPARSTTTTDLELGSGSRGIFRVVVWLDDQDGSDEEVSFAVVPRPRVAGPDRESMIGIHATSSDFQYEVLKKLGVKWQRILSPEAWFRWSIAEPEPGKFVWFDADARKTVEHGIETLGTLGAVCPHWAERGGRPDLDAWERYVRAIVAHYKPWVHYWEVWNEPIHTYPADFYAGMLQRAARAIRETDPSAKIVGMGGSYKSEWCLSALKQLGDNPRKQMDILSTHLYPDKADPLNPLNGRAAKEFHDHIQVPQRMEIWNTETGAWCLGFEKGSNSGFRAAGPSVWPQKDAWRFYRGGDYEASRVTGNFLQSIGNGFTKYFYYDSRFHHYHSAGKTHCTIFGVGDTLRAKGVAYAILANLFDHSQGLGDVSPSKDAFAYLFDRQGTPLAGLFMADETDLRKRRTLTLPLDPSRFRVLDLMGNEMKIAGAAIPFGRQPVYLEGREGLRVEELRAALAGAKLSDAPDSTPPQLSLCEGPRGRNVDRSARFRWIATDETAIPFDPASQSALLYAVRLDDGAWSSWTAKTLETFVDLKSGPHRFEVKAKDLSGNVSEVVSRDFEILP